MERASGGGAGSAAVEDEGAGKKDAGFKRSIETLTGLLFFRMRKVFGERWSTGKGPSYGGTRGRLTASTRRKTCEAPSSRGSRREGGTPWWTTGIGRTEPMTVLRWRLKSEAEGEGPDGANMSPGRRRGPP